MWDSSTEYLPKPMIGIQSKPEEREGGGGEKKRRKREKKEKRKKTLEPGREALSSCSLPLVPSIGKTLYGVNCKGDIFEGPISILTEPIGVIVFGG